MMFEIKYNETFIMDSAVAETNKVTEATKKNATVKVEELYHETYY